MTKEEFIGFSSSAQHDMVLEALVRVTKNLEILQKASGKPFIGTTKQNANDIKLLTILADAFGKNELVWDHARVYKNKEKEIDKVVVAGVGMKRYNSKPMAELMRTTEDEGITRDDGIIARGAALYTGIGHDVYMEKSKPQPWYPSPMIDVNVDNSAGLDNLFSKAPSNSVSVRDYLKEKYDKNKES